MMINNKVITPGLPDCCFIQGEAPMTKEEVRALTLTKLRLTEDSTVLDIGAGTGSITVECALLAKKGRVYAVEKNPQALELIKKNCDKFKLTNVQVIAGEAPSCLSDFPQVDRIVIGGSGGNLQEMVGTARKLLKPGGILVLNAILLETAYLGLQALKKEGFIQEDIISVSVARGRKLGGKTALKPLNPVFIMWGSKEEKGEKA